MALADQTHAAKARCRFAGPPDRAPRNPGVLWLGNQLSEISNTRAVSEDIVEHLRNAGWQVASASGKRNRILRLADMAATALRKSRDYEVGVIDVYSGKAFLFAEILSSMLRKLRKGLVLVLHGGRLLEFQQRFPQRVKRLLTQADSVVSPSKGLIQGLSLVRPDIHYIPNGIEVADYAFRLRCPALPSLCWLRAFHQTYNPVMAVETLAGVRALFPETRLTMIGPDKKDGSLERVFQRAAELKITDKVEIIGSVPKQRVPEYLSRHDILLNTTNYESFGVGVLEAAACGLCIVTTNVGELPLIWSHGKDALLVNPGDASSMASATLHALRNPTIGEALSRNAHNRAEHFDWSKVMPHWETLLEEIRA